MKIGSKIALFYTVITVGAIALIVLVFYLFTLRYINKVYDSYLSEKAYLTAQKYWEKDEVDESRYREIQQKYDELLPQAYEILLNADSVTAVADTLATAISRLGFSKMNRSRSFMGVCGARLFIIRTMKETLSFW